MLIATKNTGEQISAFSQIKEYIHTPIKKQIEHYENIYLTYGINEDIHIDELYYILINQAFPLWKSYIENNAILIRRKTSLELLNTLFQTAYKYNKKQRVTPLLFWRINILASVIIDWHKGIITGVTQSLSSEEPKTVYPSIQFLFKDLSTMGEKEWFLFRRPTFGKLFEEIQLSYSKEAVNKIADEAFNIEALSPLIIYTNCASSLSQESLLKILIKQPKTIISVFDCDLNNSAHRYNEQEKYQAHNGFLSTSCFLYHDLDHAKNEAIPSYWLELANQMYEIAHVLDGHQKKIMIDAAFFMIHEINNLLSYTIGDIVLENYDFFGTIKKQSNDTIITLLGATIFQLKHVMSLVTSKEKQFSLYKNDNGEIIKFIEDFETIEYKIRMRDWELMLHDGLPKPSKAREQDELKFAFSPRKDAWGKPLLPSLEELLVLATKEDSYFRKKLTQAKIDTKINIWKKIPKDTKLKIKKAALKNAYERFWDSVIQIILEKEPGLLIKEEQFSAFHEFISDNYDQQQNKESAPHLNWLMKHVYSDQVAENTVMLPH